MTQSLLIHDLAKIFPLIEGRAFDDLVEDIKAHGLRQPIVMHEGKVLDGRNRLRACQKIGLDPQTVPFDGADPIAFVVSANLRRRHLKDSQRALIAARIANMPHGGNRYTKTGAEITHAVAAELLNVKPRTLQWARQANRAAAPEVIDLVERGQLSVSAAGKISSLSVKEQRQLAEEGPPAITQRARKLDRLRGRHGRSEYRILWQIVDEIAAALEATRLDKAHIAANKLVREIDRVAKSRR